MPKTIDIAHAAKLLREFCRRHKRPPSYSEIAKLFGYRSKNAAHWLVKKLKAHGAWVRDAGGRLLSASPGVRLLGSVQAGFPSPAEEEPADLMSLDDYLIRHPERTYVIRVTGDSMIDAGIREGDLVVVERDKSPLAGEIVVAQVDGQWSMKHFHNSSKGPVLIAANKKYPKIRPAQELTIGGIVVGVVRKYR